ncbi:hypothetical protein [Bacillus cereus]|uniref:hypothetical protein n=1 Tax=Bacillus cereus TaxID=1396 RepID=UPI0018F442F0|nr:hypothetical protein [Bacillus cereus]MBJ8152956.1 hypothetical protein [Bacillus cereus]
MIRINQWDIKIFRKQSRWGSSIANFPDSNYMLMGEGIQFSILEGNDTAKIFNQEDYRTGIQVCYPKDKNIWEVILTETDLQ